MILIIFQKKKCLWQMDHFGPENGAHPHKFKELFKKFAE